MAILSVICTWPYYQSFVHGHIVGSYCPNSNANTTGHIQKPAFTKKIETKKINLKLIYNTNTNNMDEQQKIKTIEDNQKLFIAKVYYNLIKDKSKIHTWRDYISLENEPNKRPFKEYWRIEYFITNFNQTNQHMIKITNQIFGEHPRISEGEMCLYEKHINIVIEGDFNNYNEDNIETIFNSFKKLKNKRLKRQFNKLMCSFAKPKEVEYHQLLNKAFGGADICCVCHEDTFARTPCGHYLCFVCRSSLRKKICPICRIEITSTNSDSDSE